MKRTAILLTLVVMLALAGRALAMSSTNFRLDWFIPLTNGGGGPTSSTHYSLNFTIGQTAVGASTSAHYAGCQGYWCGITRAGAAQRHIYLPLVMRDRS
ncbi:MAG: hypothetical protein H5T60_09445 [Anaerolineae bacterium]|nr:hypothetical protein [Anaerolineae bacterium]